MVVVLFIVGVFGFRVEFVSAVKAFAVYVTGLLLLKAFAIVLEAPALLAIATDVSLLLGRLEGVRVLLVNHLYGLLPVFVIVGVLTVQTLALLATFVILSEAFTVKF